MNNLFTIVSAIAAANPAGFTYNVETNQMQESGYAVALAETQNSHGINGLENVLNLVTSGRSSATCVGGWLDQESGLFYWDAVVICKTKREAIKLGRINGQIAIFDLNEMQEIRL